MQTYEILQKEAENDVKEKESEREEEKEPPKELEECDEFEESKMKTISS